MSVPSYRDIMHTLNASFPPTAEQEAVITSESSAILVVAGAGSGKTATMTNRIAYYIATGKVRPDEVLGLTFTRKAAGELAERTEKALAKLRRARMIEDSCPSEGTPPDTSRESDGIPSESYAGEFVLAARHELERPTIATYNSFASEISASYGMLVGADPNARLMTDGERWQLMTDIVDRWQGDPHGVLADRSASGIVEIALKLASALIDNRVPKAQAVTFLTEQADLIEEMRLNKQQFRGMKEASKAWGDLAKTGILTLRARAEILSVVEEYFHQKKELGLAEFSDQVSIASQVIERYPEIGFEIAGRYRLVLLDEYQDTSVNQALFLAQALGAALPGVSRSVCAVGDPNQAIYGWRGASANALADFATQYARTLGPVERLELSTSFRNDQAILSAANAVSKQLETSGVSVSTLEAREGAGQGSVVEIRTLFRKDSYRAMARRIQQVIEEVQRDSTRQRSSDRSDRQAQIAILCRKRVYMEYAVAALDELAIPYEIVGGESLIERPEILTIRAALGVVANPARNDYLLRLLTYFGVDAPTLRRLHRWSKEVAHHEIAAITADTTKQLKRRDEQSLVEALAALPVPSRGIPRGHELFGCTEEMWLRLNHLATVLSTLRTAVHLPLSDLISFAASLLGIDVSTATRLTGGQRVRTSLDSFIALGGTYESDHPDASLADFVEWLNAVEEKEHGGEEQAGQDLAGEDVEVHPGIVQIMTIHAAKGLEWRDLVAIPELVEGEFSEKRSGVEAWPQNAQIFPFPLRADYSYLPQFDMRSYSDKFSAGEAYWHFKYEHLLDHHNQELGRLAYVAFTRPVRELLLVGYALKDDADAKRKLAAHSKLQRNAAASEDSAVPEDSPIGENMTISGNRPAAKESSIAVLSRSSYLRSIREAAESGALTVTPIADYAVQEWDKELFREVPEELTESALRSVLPPDTPLTDLEPIPDYDLMPNLPRWPTDVQRSITVVSPGPDAHIPLRANMAEDVTLLLAERKAAGSPCGIDRPYFTATDLVHLSEDAKEFVAQTRRPVPCRPSPAARQGTHLHAMIAHHFDRPATLDIDELLEINEMPVDMETITTSEEHALFEAFTTSPWSAYPPIAVEQSLEIVVAGKIFRCTIDAVLDTSSDPDLPNVTIVDWKTGRKPSAAQLPSRELQLAIYRLAWSRSLNIPLETVGARFVFLKEPVESRDLAAGLLTEPEIEEHIRQALSRVGVA